MLDMSNSSPAVLSRAETKAKGKGAIVQIRLHLTSKKEEQVERLLSITGYGSSPRLSEEANGFRRGPIASMKASFRSKLLGGLRKNWKRSTTEARFLSLAESLQRDGCIVFAGMIDDGSFHQLVDDFSDNMQRTGSHAFLHSFTNLLEHPEFLQNNNYNDAIFHPLLISLLSFVMGGPVRVTDARGKDTNPISVNAQDNMLHIDNTPFREEYKILVGWEKGKAKGPTGQNFTFLPGTHKGNRHVRVDSDTKTWSTENDSLFITPESVSNVFKFQKRVTGASPTVIEVAYPHRPITALFNAGSLVHHRYRTTGGNPRSCVIIAFHLLSDHPGAVIDERVRGSISVSDVLLRHYDGESCDNFCDSIKYEANAIETKLSEIFDDNNGSELLDMEALKLSGERFHRWYSASINAPTTTQLKMESCCFITCYDKSISRILLAQKIAAAMAYDKHGLLDLKLYDDNHEEIRKKSRKSIWSMTQDDIEQILMSWLPAIENHHFSVDDAKLPESLQCTATNMAHLIRASFPDHSFDMEEYQEREEWFVSAYHLCIDLGESLVRCEKAETYIATNLFLFLIVSRLLFITDKSLQPIAVESGTIFLRAYIACVLLVENNGGSKHSLAFDE